MGVGSTEWQQAAYGLNQTDRPGAVWLKAFTAAMDEKKRPIFSIYNPDLEDETGPLPPYVAERLLRFARAAVAVGEMRGKNYLSVGSVSMGIIGSDVRRNMMLHYLGMGSVSVDMVAIKGRIERGLFDHEELEAAFRFMKRKFKFDFGQGQRPLPPDDLLRECLRMTLIVRDFMIGNPKLADRRVGKAQGFQGGRGVRAGAQCDRRRHAGAEGVDRFVSELRHGRVAALQLVRLERIPRPHGGGDGERFEERDRHAAGASASRAPRNFSPISGRTGLRRASGRRLERTSAGSRRAG